MKSNSIEKLAVEKMISGFLILCPFFLVLFHCVFYLIHIGKGRALESITSEGESLSKG